MAKNITVSSWDPYTTTTREDEMHCCGNPLHDIPSFLMAAGPALGAMVWWFRARVFRPR